MRVQAGSVSDTKDDGGLDGGLEQGLLYYVSKDERHSGTWSQGFEVGSPPW